jgi:hypothetical protein
MRVGIAGNPFANAGCTHRVQLSPIRARAPLGVECLVFAPLIFAALVVDPLAFNRLRP